MEGSSPATYQVTFEQFKTHCPALFESFFPSINNLLKRIEPDIQRGKIVELYMTPDNTEYVRFSPEGQSLVSLFNSVPGLEAKGLIANHPCWLLRIWAKKSFVTRIEILDDDDDHKE